MTYLTIHDDVSFLVTQHSVYTERYNCWMIYTYPEFMSYRPWRNIYVLPQETCANWINSDAIRPDRADIILRAYSGSNSTVENMRGKVIITSKLYSKNPQIILWGHFWEGNTRHLYTNKPNLSISGRGD